MIRSHKSYCNEGKTVVNGLKLNNPLPDMIKSVGQLAKVFQKYPLIPWLGTSVNNFHKQVDLMHSLHDFSVTQNAIDSKILLNSFGSNVIAFDGNNGFGKSKDLIESVNHRILYDFLEGCGYDAGDISEMAKAIYKKSNPTGNAYILVEFFEVAGVKDTKITIYDQRWVTRLVPIGDERQFIVTPQLDEWYWQNVEEPLVVNEFTNVSELEEDADGVKRAIFHYKHSGYSDSWYAISNLGQAAIFPLFNEFQQWDMLIKETDNMFIGRLLVFFENYYSEQGKDYDEARELATRAVNDMTLRFKKAATAGSDTSTAMIPILYGKGTQPPTTAVLPSNTNEKWHESIEKKVSTAIHRLNNVDPEITGLEQVGGGFNGDKFKEKKKTFNHEKIKPTQRVIGNQLQKVFNAIAEFKGTDLKKLQLGWLTPFQEELEEKKEIENEPIAA